MPRNIGSARSASCGGLRAGAEARHLACRQEGLTNKGPAHCTRYMAPSASVEETAINCGDGYAVKRPFICMFHVLFDSQTGRKRCHVCVPNIIDSGWEAKLATGWQEALRHCTRIRQPCQLTRCHASSARRTRIGVTSRHDICSRYSMLQLKMVPPALLYKMSMSIVSPIV